MLARACVVVLTATAFLGCSEQQIPSGELDVTLGQETDTWSRDPAPTKVVVDKQLADGTTIRVSSGAPPLDHVSLGDGAQGYYRVTATDAQGVVRASGRSIEVDPAGLAGLGVPLFVGRGDAFSRPPGHFVTVHGDALPVATVAGRHLLVAGAPAGGGFDIDGYDFASWAPHVAYAPVSCPGPDCTVRSLAVFDVTVALFVGDDWAITLDTASGVQTTVALPAGLQGFNEIAGGQTVVAGDGTAYIVGATRAATPTTAVLRVSASGVPTVLRLGTPRAGAAATWIAGRGLVVVGGSAGGPGGEILADGASAFSAVPYPPDPTTGAGLVATDADTVLRLGGRDASGAAAPTVSLAVGCQSDCQAAATAPDVALDGARAFALSGGAIAVAGTDASGATAAFHVHDGVADALPLAEPRHGATPILAPNGALALVGGTHPDGTPATSVELALP